MRKAISMALRIWYNGKIYEIKEKRKSRFEFTYYQEMSTFWNDLKREKEYQCQYEFDITIKYKKKKKKIEWSRF